MFTLVAAVLLLNGALQAAGVVFSYVNRDMMTALADRDGTTFFQKMLLVVIYTLVAGPVVAIGGYVTGQLILHWRRWLTERFLERTFHDRAFYRISSDAKHRQPRPESQRAPEHLCRVRRSSS